MLKSLQSCGICNCRIRSVFHSPLSVQGEHLSVATHRLSLHHGSATRLCALWGSRQPQNCRTSHSPGTGSGFQHADELEHLQRWRLQLSLSFSRHSYSSSSATDRTAAAKVPSERPLEALLDGSRGDGGLDFCLYGLLRRCGEEALSTWGCKLAPLFILNITVSIRKVIWSFRIHSWWSN